MGDHIEAQYEANSQIEEFIILCMSYESFFTVLL